MPENSVAAYLEEAPELLAELESALLELEQAPQDDDLIGRAFRALHTLKGSGAMFGFEDIASFTHQIENAFDRVREGKLTVSKALIDATLQACDRIRTMLDSTDHSAHAEAPETAAISQRFQELCQTTGEAGGAPASSKQQQAASPALPAKTTPDALPATYRIHFKPAPHLFASGTNPLLLLRDLEELGTATFVANSDRVPPLDEIDPELCYTAWNIILTTSRGLDAIKDVFTFVEDDCDLRIDVIDTGSLLGDDELPVQKRLGEILVERGEITDEDVQAFVASQRRLGELLVQSGRVSAGSVEAALAEQHHIAESRRQRQADLAAASIRVPAAKLDTLVNMVGELVTVQSRLNQVSSLLNHPALIQIAEEVERLTADLRDSTMSIRMLPIGTIFAKFSRLVRDLAQELGKDVTLETSGGETELDKTVIEHLNDPLVHLIRNAIDHGIESAEERGRQGKPGTATVRLTARHEGASVMVEVCDDGAGIRRNDVRRRAVEAGLIAPDAIVSDKALLGLIFEPGFSTAGKITHISGRGVGLDVVKRSVDGLGGAIEVESVEERGTVVRMRLPLTLAIIDGLLVRIGESHFVLPLSAIEECVELTLEENRSRNGRNLAFIRGDLVPYIPLRERFDLQDEAPRIQQIVTSRVDGMRVGILVDQVVGQHQTVIKSLGRWFRGSEEFSGATILGDGRVALILDLPKLVRKVEREEHEPEEVGVG